MPVLIAFEVHDKIVTLVLCIKPARVELVCLRRGVGDGLGGGFFQVAVARGDVVDADEPGLRGPAHVPCLVVRNDVPPVIADREADRGSGRDVRDGVGHAEDIVGAREGRIVVEIDGVVQPVRFAGRCPVEPRPHLVGQGVVQRCEEAKCRRRVRVDGDVQVCGIAEILVGR